MHAVEFALVGARTDSEFEPSIAQEIGKGGLAGQIDGVPIGRHRHRRAQPDLLRVGAPPGEDLEGVGRDGHLQRVVLRRPGDTETGPVGHLDHLQGVIPDIGHVDAVVAAFQVNGQLEFHGSCLLPWCSFFGAHRATNWLASGALEVFIQTVLGRV